MSSLAQSLRQAIRESGLSISELAERAGVAKSRISTFLNDDEKTISLRTAEAIGKVVGWPRHPRFPILIRGPRSWIICRLEQQTRNAQTFMIAKHLDPLTGSGLSLKLRYWVVDPIDGPEPSDYALARLDADEPTAIEKIFVPDPEQIRRHRRPKR